MRALVTLLLLLLPAAAAGQAPLTPYSGRYFLGEINGRQISLPPSTTGNLLAHRGWLDLQADGSYAMGQRADLPARANLREIGEDGTWRVTGDTMTFAPRGSRPQRYAWCQEGDTLYLRDGRGNAYVLRNPILDVVRGRTCPGWSAPR
jgi:hypothetical protein